MRIEVYRGKGKSRHRWYFRVKASNGEIVASGEGYTRKHDAKIGAERLVEGMHGLGHRPTSAWLKVLD